MNVHADKLLINAFPRRLTPKVQNVIPLLRRGSTEAPGYDYFKLNGENLQIPRRIYHAEPRFPSNLTEKQILRCVLTRHCNGYWRERYLKELFDHPCVEWVYPYVVQLLGEYVLEIHVVLQQNLHRFHQASFKAFLAENPTLIPVTKARIISYWDVYYRNQYWDIRMYPAFQVADALGWWHHKDLRRVLHTCKSDRRNS